MEEFDWLLSSSGANDSHQRWDRVGLQELAGCSEEQSACRSVFGRSLDAAVWSENNLGKQRQSIGTK